MSLVLLPAASTAADRWERARLIIPSLWITAISLAVIGLATSTPVFLVGSLLLGLEEGSAAEARWSVPRRR